jgi:hypothetical protein
MDLAEVQKQEVHTGGLDRRSTQEVHTIGLVVRLRLMDYEGFETTVWS